jgi:hypothetical protein
VPSPDGRPLPYPRKKDTPPAEFRRLLDPDPRDRDAAVLLRHPDLLEPIAEMHRSTLLYLLDAEPAGLASGSAGIAPQGADVADTERGLGFA